MKPCCINFFIYIGYQIFITIEIEYYNQLFFKIKYKTCKINILY